MSILDDDKAMTAVDLAGYGFLILSPNGGNSYDDDRIERIVVKLAESMKEIAESEDATFPDMMCAAMEFAARIMSAPTNIKGGNRTALKRLADDMAKNFRGRIIDSARNLGPGQAPREQ